MCYCLRLPSESRLFVLTRHFGSVLQNWAGMRCPYKLLRMILALVCSKLPRQTFNTVHFFSHCCRSSGMHLVATDYTVLFTAYLKLAPLFAFISEKKIESSW